MSHGPLPRSLPDVIDAMLAVIPATEHDLRHDLASIRESSVYAPPENQAIWWHQTLVLIAARGRPTQDWQWRMASIYADKPVEQLKKGMV